MKQKYFLKFCTIAFMFMLPLGIMAQTVKGKVTDSSGEALPYMNIVEKGNKSNGVVSGDNGEFSITFKSLPATIIISSMGFKTKTVKVTNTSFLTIIVNEDNALDEVVITGSRTPVRSNTKSPLPIDIVSSKDLVATGQTTFDKALQFKIPSFNTVQTPVNDATSLLDPYEIRNMGPSRTLILINGKRKNLSALLYTQTSPGRGETGSDISGIPIDAIKDIQVLRDGASAQYGSDAIAGVINIILKDNVDGGSATLRTGMTSEGDGEMFGVSVNNGASIGEDKGFVNYTVDFSKTSLANRPGTVDAAGEAADFGANIADVNEFLSRNPDANNINGSPETAAAKFLVNGEYNLSDESKVYFNAAFINKKVNSFANYRTPYWRSVDAYPYLADFFPGDNPTTAGGYDGYVPTFEGDLNDYNATVGFKSIINDWNVDASFTTGGNTQTYKVNQSHNRNVVYSPSTWVDANGNGAVDAGEITEGSQLYGSNSKQSFDPGGTGFYHNVGNLDISKILTDNLSVAFGTEFRYETFEVIEGELASYDGGGADSFAGNSPENSGKFTRYNFGGYASLNWNPVENLTLDGTIRSENYSDFGNAFVWKASGAYTISDKYTLRSSLSTGFRAPTLHQIYTQKAQYSFVPGQGIQVGGLVNNVSSQAQLLGIDKLDAETSTNFTLGLGGKVNKNLSFTVDYYSINVEDRIVLSTEIGPTAAGNTALDQVLNANNLSDLSFFTNAIDTKTSGIDVVIGYNKIEAGEGMLGFNLSGNYVIENARDGAVKNPSIVASAGQSVVNQTQEALFFTSRPETKWILGTTYDVGKFGFNLNNTFFGKTTFFQQGLATESVAVSEAYPTGERYSLRTEFTPKVVTDLGINFNATDKLTFALNINNLFNVLPEWGFKAETPTGEAILADPAQVKNQSNLITFNQRYSQMTYDGSHFSQLGTMFNLSLNYQF
ncbi:TonB-dependent receptor [Polaribacter litorisediminis]|uniref:TonB-dependent receptor n=1 Tax=Polaribacter litorisediminis TaxID=1908341 RepID=UPI001CBEF68B|nr:TonB-dependent receptor [Polaribacter litorisediminis]UAM98075.1 TonB-dependent receptor [Polaribacter litorisediminis]